MPKDLNLYNLLMGHQGYNVTSFIHLYGSRYKHENPVFGFINLPIKQYLLQKQVEVADNTRLSEFFF